MLDLLHALGYGITRSDLQQVGVYDNTGLEPISSSRYDDFFSLSLAAGGVFTVGSSGILPLVGVLSRANSVMYRETRLRTRDMVRRIALTPPPRSGAVFTLTTSIPNRERNPAYDDFVARDPEDRTYDGEDLAFVATTFRKLDASLIRKLIYRVDGSPAPRWRSGTRRWRRSQRASPPPVEAVQTPSETDRQLYRARYCHALRLPRRTTHRSICRSKMCRKRYDCVYIATLLSMLWPTLLGRIAESA